MARKIFAWENFPYGFLKSVLYGNETPVVDRPVYAFKEEDMESMIPYMNRICSRPDEWFVRKYRRCIEDNLLDGTNYLVDLVKALNKINYGGLQLTDNDQMMLTLRSKRMTQTLCNAYIRILKTIGTKAHLDDDSLFSLPTTVDLLATDTDKVSLYPYQENAVNAMKEYFIEGDNKSAILSMPTGSGKTRTSVYFLLKEMVSMGYQVIWLCHRSMLIEQAAEQFYRFSPLIKENNQDMTQFKMVCISGKHANVRALERDDNLIISSVQSLCNNTVYLPNILSEKVIVVVDEAHHTLAPSYRRIIKAVREKRPDAKLLGLTATPVRLTENATEMLMKIFDNKIVFSVSMSDLIADGTLATPVYIPRETNLDIEAMINVDERAYIKKWGELPEGLVTRVASVNERNRIIVDEYVNNKDKYGKTIIFAMNAIHCDSLNEAFKAKGIRSDYVYTVVGSAQNQRIIDRFKNNELDVLININILTEGSDIPDIETVFLTRPTMSDVLLMQMVGRGMRGKGCGGTEKVNIVDFCDKWSSITGWLTPKFITDGVLDPEDEEYEYERRDSSLIPMDAIRDIVRGITYNNDYVKAGNATLPIGWYDVYDEDGNDVKVLVFENQEKGYQEFSESAEDFMEKEFFPRDIVLRFFSNFELLPASEDLSNILRYIRQEKEFPVFHTYEVRNDIDPYVVAEKIKNEDLKFSEISKMIDDICGNYQGMVLSLFGSFDYYRKRVMDFVMYEGGIVPIGTIIEETEKETYKLSNEPISQGLEELLDEVIEEYRENFPENFVRPTIAWTKKPLGSYYGQYQSGYNYIQINSLLNSVSVPIEAIKFIIYHECLHQEIMDHSKAFREKERLFKDFQEQEYFLDYTLRNFEM